MGRTLIIISTLILLFSCRQNKQIPKFVFKPTAEPLSKYAEQTFTEAFFSENHYSYSEWAKVDSSEKLTGSFVDATTGQTVLDKSKYFYSAETFIIDQGDTTFMRSCKTSVADKDLRFVLNDDPFSLRNTELEFVKSGNNFISNYVVTAVLTDSSYKLPTFTVLTQKILLDKENYEKGNNLKGKISFTVKAYYPMSNVTDTIKIFGLLKTTVE